MDLAWAPEKILEAFPSPAGESTPPERHAAHVKNAKELEAQGMADGAARVLAGWLNGRSWFAVRSPGGSQEAYARGLREAEAACRLRPEHALYLNTLGVARYRAGTFNEALATLVHADDLNRGATQPYPRASDLLFIALCHERLGDRERAREVLAEARRELGGKATGELTMFLEEAEREIGAPETPRARPSETQPKLPPEAPKGSMGGRASGQSL